jgi:hypothetical protein
LREGSKGVERSRVGIRPSLSRSGNLATGGYDVSDGCAVFCPRHASFAAAQRRAFTHERASLDPHSHINPHKRTNTQSHFSRHGDTHACTPSARATGRTVMHARTHAPNAHVHKQIVTDEDTRANARTHALWRARSRRILHTRLARSSTAAAAASPPDGQGLKRMYLALVSVGDCCKGNRDERTPSKSRPGTSSDHEVYPERVIKACAACRRLMCRLHLSPLTSVSLSVQNISR